MKWAPDNLDGYLNFYSVSADGRVTNWTLVKTALWCNDVLFITFNKTLVHIGEDSISDSISGKFELTSVFLGHSLKPFFWSFHARWWPSVGFQTRWWHSIPGWYRSGDGLPLHHWVLLQVPQHLPGSQHPCLQHRMEHLHPEHFHHLCCRVGCKSLGHELNVKKS